MTLSAVMPVTSPTNRLRTELPTLVGSSGQLRLVPGDVCQLQPVNGQPAGLILDRSQDPVLGPPPDGVVTDAQETCCFSYARARVGAFVAVPVQGRPPVLFQLTS
jgi:hypothetical protein